MNTDEHPVAGTFDEARALEQLEELHEQILRARDARRRVEAEFDAFVQGFRRERPPHEERAAPVPPRRPAAAKPADPAPQNVAVAARGPVEPPPATLTVDTAVPAPPAAVASVDAAPPFEPETVAPRDAAHVAADVIARPVPPVGRGGRVWAVFVIGAVAVGAVAFALWGRQGPPASPASAPAAAAKPAQPVVTPPPAAAPAAPVPGVNLELVTHRRVWVRVTIDGKRAFERELPADQRIPLHGEQTILIRAGDAGAITLTRDGRDAGVLGRDGMIATREFTVPR